MPRVTRNNPRMLYVSLALLSCAMLIAAVWQTTRRAEAAEVTRSEPLVRFANDSAGESSIRDRDIQFYQQRVAADQQSATDRAMLGGLLFSRARSTGSSKDLDRAEAVVRESLRLRGQRNGAAFELLASILMSRHNFREAHDVASRADSLAPNTPSHLALLGEIELELGDYAAAAAHFTAVHFDGQQFAIGARLARWYELTGRADVARAMLQRSIAQVGKRDDLPAEQISWFDYRLGELELRLGKFSAADSAFQRGLKRNPDDLRILSGLARSALARGNPRAAVDYGERTIGMQLDPTVLGTLSEAWAALGDSAQSAQYTTAMSVAALTQPGAIHRAWGLHLLDHGSVAARADVLRRAQQDIRERRDIYGHDLLAWALHRAGRHAAAQREMRLALSHGTEDVQLHAHARAIGIAPTPPLATAVVHP